MDVTWRRLTLAVLGLGAVLLPLRKTSSPTAGRDDREKHLQQLSQELRDARTRWTALVARDSVLAVSPQIDRAGSKPVVLVRGFPAQVNGEGVSDRLASEWKALGQGDSTVSTAVYVYNDSFQPGEPTWGSYRGNFITQRDGRLVCVSIVPGEIAANGSLLVGSGLFDVSSAPCALLRAFGKPGADVAAWLDTTRYISARSNAWFIPETRRYEFDFGPWAWLPSADDRPFQEAGFLTRLFGRFQVGEALTPPYRFGASGIRCLSGEEQACVNSVLHSGVMHARDSKIPRDLTVGVTLLKPDTVTMATARPPEANFISDLIRDKGRDRFRTFWKSDRSFEQAFQAAFGESLGHWTAAWARHKWNSSWEAHYGHATIKLGTTLSGSWPFLVVGWTVLTLAAVFWTARRKQVT